MKESTPMKLQSCCQMEAGCVQIVFKMHIVTHRSNRKQSQSDSLFKENANAVEQ